MTSESTISLIISIFALIIATLVYFDTRKKTKIFIEKEKERENIKKTLGALNRFSKSLKELSFGSPELYFAATDILRELSERGGIKLKIEIKNPDLNLDLIKERKINFASSDDILALKLKFRAEPDIIQNTWIDLRDVVYPLSKTYSDYKELKKQDKVIESLDSQILPNIEENLNEILSLFRKAIRKKSYEFEFKKDTKISEIENKLDEILNLNKVNSKAGSFSTDIMPKIEIIKKNLFEISSK
jgi:hypothetical protein